MNDDTTINNTVGWETGPKSRGTLSLLWSCMATIFACTWTVLHLNVPGHNDGLLQKTGRKVKWMAINILFPELLFSKAVCDLRQALEEMRDLGDHVQEIGPLTKRTEIMGFDQDDTREQEGAWDVEYPWLASLLYRLLLLKRPAFSKIDQYLPSGNLAELEGINADSPDSLEENTRSRSDVQPDWPNAQFGMGNAQAKVPDDQGETAIAPS